MARDALTHGIRLCRPQSPRNPGPTSVVTTATNVDDPEVAALLLAELVNQPEPYGGVHAAVRIAHQARPIAILRGHKDRVEYAEFSADGMRVITTSEDNTARIWRADGRSDPTVITVDDVGARSTLFSPDLGRAATLSQDGAVRLWRTDGRSPPIELHGPTDDVHHLGAWPNSFSPDGKWLVTGSFDGDLWLWRTDQQPSL